METKIDSEMLHKMCLQLIGMSLSYQAMLNHINNLIYNTNLLSETVNKIRKEHWLPLDDIKEVESFVNKILEESEDRISN